ncbi:hypothetical protein BGW41_004999 [Actinomortierella wolfii]|nr:hypothetical protein BGW41_004999 [Actinomortierella wolfii]
MRPTEVDSQVFRSPHLSPPSLRCQLQGHPNHSQQQLRQQTRDFPLHDMVGGELVHLVPSASPPLASDIQGIPSHVRNMSHTTPPTPVSYTSSTETEPLPFRRSSTHLAALLLADLHPRHVQEQGEKTFQGSKHLQPHQQKQKQQQKQQQESIERSRRETAEVAHCNFQDHRSYDNLSHPLSQHHPRTLRRQSSTGHHILLHDRQHQEQQESTKLPTRNPRSPSLSPSPSPSLPATVRALHSQQFALSPPAPPSLDPTEPLLSQMPSTRKPPSASRQQEQLEQRHFSSTTNSIPRRSSSVGRVHPNNRHLNWSSAKGWTCVSSTAKNTVSNITNTPLHSHTLGHQSEPESEGEARHSPLHQGSVSGIPRPRSTSSCSTGSRSNLTSTMVGPNNMHRAPGIDKRMTLNLNGQMTSDPSQPTLLVQPFESSFVTLTSTTGGDSVNCASQQHQQQYRHQSLERNGSMNDSGGSRVTAGGSRSSPAAHTASTTHTENVGNNITSTSLAGPENGWNHISDFLMALVSQSLASRIFARRPQVSSIGSAPWSLVRILNTAHLLYLIPVTTVTIARLVTTEYICDEQLFSWLTVQAVLFVAQIFSACYMLQRQPVSSRLALLDQRSRVLMIVFMIWTVLGVGFLSGNGRSTCPCSSLALQQILPVSVSSELSRTATKPMLESLDSRPMVEGMFGEDPEEATCAICLGDYQPKEPIRFLPCQHHFHLECVDQWLLTDKSCPLCKHDIDQPMLTERLRRQSSQQQLGGMEVNHPSPYSLPADVSFEMGAYHSSSSTSSSHNHHQHQHQPASGPQDANPPDIASVQNVGCSQAFHVVIL